MVKYTKHEVDYSKGMLQSHCGPVFHDDKFYCRHFEPSRYPLGSCELVEGRIDPGYWCKRYNRIEK